MTTVDAVVFPLSLSRASVGGPRFSTETETLDSGFGVSNQLWSQAVYEFDAGPAIRTIDDFNSLYKFFVARAGNARGFLFTHCLDNSTAANHVGSPSKTDVTIDTGDGVTAVYQLSKIYTDAGNTITRVITRPQSGTVIVAVDGVVKTEDTDYTVNYTTGKITFTSGAIPASGTVISVGFKFYIPVKFDVAFLPMSYRIFNVESIPIVEVRE